MATRSYEAEVLAVLAFEPATPSGRAAADRKIKRRLREKKLGPCDPARISAIRAFNNDVLHELGKSARSKFFRGSKGEFSDMQDWDVAGLVAHMQRKHPALPKSAIRGFLPEAIFLYYLR